MLAAPAIPDSGWAACAPGASGKASLAAGLSAARNTGCCADAAAARPIKTASRSLEQRLRAPEYGWFRRSSRGVRLVGFAIFSMNSNLSFGLVEELYCELQADPVA